MGLLRELQQDFPPLVVDIVRLSIWLLLLMVIFVPLERLFTITPQRIFRKAWLTDLGYFFLNGLLTKAARLPYGGDRVGAASCGAECNPFDPSRIASVGAAGAGFGRGRNRILLGPPLDPRDPISLALPFDPLQCAGSRLAGQ